ncbi:MAG TPA: sensor histidine kinase [Puia sp.]|nr:sensor histidine kinase [Puia sp.]
MRGKKAQSLVEIIMHVLFWTGVYYALKALTVSSFKMISTYNDKATMSMDAHSIFPYPWVVLGALIGLFYGNTLWLFPRLIRRRSRGPGIAIVAVWAAFMFTLNYGVVRLLIGPAGNIPPRHITVPNFPHYPESPPGFSANDWMHMQGVMTAIFLSIIGIAVAYFFIREWIHNDLRRSQAETQQLHTELRFLRSQVNPHFLFNTLNNLFSMAQKKGHEELADSISRLSDMMRYMIYESNTDTVSLQREIAYVKDCIALNKLRYADSEASVTFRHPPPAVAAGISIAPMLFIPFLENAFKHGVAIGHHSHITLDLSVEQRSLTFTCENTDHSAVQRLDPSHWLPGPPLPDGRNVQEGSGGIGLENVRRRLELVYPGRHALQAGPGEGKYIVNLQIQLA